jgi:phospholipid/cholesterol/gamma-HCH transport system substrate-binding protein
MKTPRKLEIEVKVGIFVALGTLLIALSIMSWGEGGTSFITKNNKYVVRFPDVTGLIQGSKVILGGVRVGVVESYDLDPSKQGIRVQLSIMRKYEGFLKPDSVAELATQGVLGDKYISISGGSESQAPIPNGGEIRTMPSKGLAELLTGGEAVMVSLKSIASSLDRVMKSLESNGRAEILFSSLAKTSTNLAELSGKFNKEFDQIQLKKSIASLSQILDKINSGTGTLGALVNDPGLYDDARALLGGVNRNRIMRNLVRKTVRDGDEPPPTSTPSERP